MIVSSVRSLHSSTSTTTSHGSGFIVIILVLNTFPRAQRQLSRTGQEPSSFANEEAAEEEPGLGIGFIRAPITKADLQTGPHRSTY